MAGGQCTSDNLPPRFSQIQYAWRSPNLDIQQRIYNVLENNARRAAEATGCEVSIRWVTKTRVGLPNHAMAQLTYDNLALFGPPVLDEDARAFGRAIQQNLDMEPMDNPFTDECQQLISPTDFEAQVRRQIPPWQANYTSDDYVDYTWHAPHRPPPHQPPRPQAPNPRLRLPRLDAKRPRRRLKLHRPGHVRRRQDHCRHPHRPPHPTRTTRHSPGRIHTTHRRRHQRRQLGRAPPPQGLPPPVDLRWPEYIETPRGREWWLPTPLT